VRGAAQGKGGLQQRGGCGPHVHDGCGAWRGPTARPRDGQRRAKAAGSTVSSWRPAGPEAAADNSVVLGRRSPEGRGDRRSPSGVPDGRRTEAGGGLRVAADGGPWPTHGTSTSIEIGDARQSSYWSTPWTRAPPVQPSVQAAVRERAGLRFHTCSGAWLWVTGLLHLPGIFGLESAKKQALRTNGS